MSKWYELPTEAELRAWYNQTDKRISFEEYERRTIAMRKRKAAYHAKNPDVAYGEGIMMAKHWNRNLSPWEGQSEPTAEEKQTVSKAKRTPGHGSHVEGGRYYMTYDDPILPSQAFVWEWLQFTVDEIPEVRTGKWMLFNSMEETDRLWPLLKDAMQQRLLGESMKAATKVTRTGVLICIYTKDWQNVGDVRRVLVALRKIIGDTVKIFYKSDEQTNLGLSGSIYCSPSGDTVELTVKGKEWFASKGIPLPTG